MRKDKLSSFQAKKQKLKKIKERISVQLAKEHEPNYFQAIKDIWEIVKDEN